MGKGMEGVREAQLPREPILVPILLTLAVPVAGVMQVSRDMALPRAVLERALAALEVEAQELAEVEVEAQELAEVEVVAGMVQAVLLAHRVVPATPVLLALPVPVALALLQVRGAMEDQV